MSKPFMTHEEFKAIEDRHCLEPADSDVRKLLEEVRRLKRCHLGGMSIQVDRLINMLQDATEKYGNTCVWLLDAKWGSSCLWAEDEKEDWIRGLRSAPVDPDNLPPEKL